ncbi:MAG TPA: ribosomal protein S18-alanine N-acetyltransferase [Thermomicrobiaceae bacterium]|nr:ribosomal protein S18-alanine N-acetyltransferase [Thermomicrobiaceae bacterium]
MTESPSLTRRFYLEAMRSEDISEVSSVERRCFPNPWPESAYRRELRNPGNNYYVVLRDGTPAPAAQADASAGSGVENAGRGRIPFLPLRRHGNEPSTDPIVGFSGMWILYDEAHVTTIGVLPEFRGLGLGELLLSHLFGEARRRRAEWLTLEVRVSNSPAQSLYEKYGFTRQGLRRRYYSDNGEDAYIMWSSSLRDAGYNQKLEDLHDRLLERLASENIQVGKGDHDHAHTGP